MHVVGGIYDRGFTMLELLVTMAVAAVLLCIAIPSYRGLVSRNAMAAQVNDLVGALQYTRSQAVTRGQRVYLCKSSDQETCAKNGDWSQGWIVYTPDAGAKTPTPSNLLRVHGPLTDQIRICGNNNLEKDAFFDANGFAMGSRGHFTASAPDSAQQTQIVIAGSGRIHLESASGDDCS
jgi:type IV fimbrial biogenesis protein FimT